MATPTNGEREIIEAAIAKVGRRDADGIAAEPTAIVYNRHAKDAD